MRKRIFSIWSVLLVLLVSIAVLVPSCASTTVTQTNIDVKAILDNSAWTGAVQYTLTLPGAAAPTVISGASVASTHRNVNPGSWTCAYVGGGPGTFVNITPGATQTLSAGSTITFTLNFVTTQVPELDHFKCYWVEQGASVNVNVELEDQFGTVEATVTNPLYFCNPVEKTYDGEVTEIKDDNNHLTVYNLDHEEELQKLVVEVDNQFGEQNLKVWGPVMLAVPTQKEGHDYPEDLDHFLLYYATGPDINVVVQLEDQFHSEPQVTVIRPVFFANPVQKTIAGTNDVILIQNPNDHLVFYEIPEELFQTDVSVENQFGAQTLSLYGSYLLAVPSSKISYGPPPPLDHLKFYEVVNGPDADVLLPQVEDQFYTGIQEVEVQSLRYFGNPVAKTHDGTVTPIGDSDCHLALYDITTPVTQNWLVEVDNQFGEQSLTVTGPVMLAVPTWKEEHGFPVWLDHYLLYKVIEGEDVQKVVDLEDQWHKESNVEVHHPVYFANPAGKASPYVDWGPGMELTIHNTVDHIVFYEIVGETFQKNVKILNQLHQQWQTISVEEAHLLAVPSEKISYEEVEPEPMLDHFLSYVITSDLVPLQAHVYLEDQFCSVEVMEEWPWLFCNPTEKHYEVVTPISYPDHHLEVYSIFTEEEPQHWLVNVNNQFGTQPLIVYGPVALAVPTQKLEPGGHDPPVGLDHFMLYEIIEGPSFDNLVVGVDDEFHDIMEGQVIAPRYFANPVRKTDATGMVTEIVNTQVHLVFYQFMAGQYQYPGIVVVNQFEQQTFELGNPVFLVTPSQKISWEEWQPQ